MRMTVMTVSCVYVFMYDVNVGADVDVVCGCRGRCAILAVAASLPAPVLSLSRAMSRLLRACVIGGFRCAVSWLTSVVTVVVDGVTLALVTTQRTA